MKIGKIIKLVILSLLVGLLLATFGITPVDFWRGVLDFGQWLWEFVLGFMDQALIYIILGGAVVVPIYAVRWLLKSRPRRARKNDLANKDLGE